LVWYTQQGFSNPSNGFYRAHDSKSDQDTLNLFLQFKEEKKKEFDERYEKIDKKALQIHEFVGELYLEIRTANYYLKQALEDSQNNQLLIEEWKDKYNRAIHESDIVRDHIDYFLFSPLDYREFENIQFSNVLKSDCIVVVGSKREQKEEVAEDLKKNIIKYCEKVKGKVQFDIEKDTQIKLNEELLRKNLILIGGPRVNSLTRHISNKLPLQYVQTEDQEIIFSDNIYSRINDKIYSGHMYAVIQAINNPFAANKNKLIVIVYGSDEESTKIVVEALTDILTDNIKEEDNGKIISSYRSIVLSKECGKPPYKFVELWDRLKM
jgi:S-layer like family, C-terminal region